MKGYIVKDIADITEPETITLSEVPNFVQFTGKPASKTYTEIKIQVNKGITPVNSLLRITDASGIVRTYRGTTDAAEAGGSVFYVSGIPSETAENLRQALLTDSWFGANFHVTIPFFSNMADVYGGAVLWIKSKGAGTDFNIKIEAPANANNTAYTIDRVNPASINNDSISGEASTAEIDLDIYVNPAYGGPPTKPDNMGTYLITLRKTYAGSPVWFELNSLFSRYGGCNLPAGSPGWFDTGTLTAYRFTAKIKAVNSFYFYASDVLYVLNGYGSVFDDRDMSEYVLTVSGDFVKLLTDKPRTPYVRGQKEYLNFIVFERPAINRFLRVAYRAYGTGGDYLGTVYGPEKDLPGFSSVNTCVLDIDTVLDRYPAAGVIRVALARYTANVSAPYKQVSNDLEYTVRPGCLHTLRQFSFINRLGGWDAFNFDADVKEEIKPSVETYDKTVTPSSRKGDGIETVYNTTLSDIFTVEGAPVTDETAVWLKELAAAHVILDNDGNRVIIEDFALQVTGADKNMHKPTIKYRMSE